MAESSFDQSEPSVVPFKQLVRAQAAFETFIRSEKIRWSNRSYALLVRSRLIAQTVWMRLLRRGSNPSAFPDHMQILTEFDPAAVWQNSAEVHTGINHAIAAND